MWALFGHIYLTGIFQDMYSLLDTKKDSWHNKVGQCAQNKLTLSCPKLNAIGRV